MPRLKKIYFLIGIALVLIIARTITNDDPDSLRFEREETENERGFRIVARPVP